MGKRGQYLHALERFGGISAAAEELGISQPALSLFLKKVEGDVGVPLFDRSKGGMKITDAGRVYLEYLEGVEDLDRSMRKRISDIGSLKSGKLAIGGATSYNICYLPKALSRFSREYPGIDIELVDGTVPDIESRALDGEVDMIITPRLDEISAFEYDDLVEERMVICVPPHWDIVEKLPTPGSDGVAHICEEELVLLDGLPFVLLREGQQIGQLFRKLLERSGVTRGKTIIVDQTLTGLALTLQGFGVSMVADSTLAYSGLHEKPALYVCDADLCRRKLYLAWPRDRYLSNATREFARILKEMTVNG